MVQTFACVILPEFQTLRIIYLPSTEGAHAPGTWVPFYSYLSFFLLLIYFMITSLGLVTNITLITQLNSCIFFGSGNICLLASQLCTSILLLDYFSELQILFHNYRSFVIFVKSRGIFFDFHLRNSYYFQPQSPRRIAMLLVAESIALLFLPVLQFVAQA